MPLSHETRVDEALSDEVDDLVLSALADAEMAGCSVALTRNGVVLHTAGYGWAELETQRELTASTPVLLSSVSKTFVGIAAMQAVEAGRVELDQPVSELVRFSVDNPRVEGETLSLRHLLTHNGSIQDGLPYLYSYAPDDPVVSLGEYLAEYLVPGGRLYSRHNWAKREPGTGFAYSNTGAALAGHALGNAAELEFSELVYRDITGPLGMNDSAYFLDELEEEPAVPYATVGGGDFQPYGHYSYPTYPDGLMHSSARDMARYLAMVQLGGELEGSRVMESASVETMLTVDDAYGTDEGGQAIIWSRAEHLGEREVIGHNGGDFGSIAELRTDRDTGTGVYLAAASHPSTNEGWQALFELQEALHDRVDEWEVAP